MSNLDIIRRHGTEHSRYDSSPDRCHIKKNKQILRFETTTMDSESEIHVDTEVNTVVDSDNEPRVTLRLKLKTKQAVPT